MLIFCQVIRTLNKPKKITSEKEMITPLSELENKEQGPKRMAELGLLVLFTLGGTVGPSLQVTACSSLPISPSRVARLWPAGLDLAGE